MTEEELRRKCASLHAVGGLYEIVSLIVWADNVDRTEDDDVQGL